MDTVRKEKAEFVLTGKPAYMETKRLMARDPDVVAQLEEFGWLLPFQHARPARLRHFLRLGQWPTSQHPVERLRYDQIPERRHHRAC